MKVRDLSRRSLGPLDNLSVIRRYFAAVKSMDGSAVRGRKFNTERIMKLWNPKGQLKIRGKETVGEHSFSGAREISSFYVNRARGVDGQFKTNLSKIDVANAKNGEHVVVSGIRYIVTRQGEGLQAPFTHNFKLEDGKITALDIHVGKPGESKLAPIGELQIEDLGKLSAMAWMVA